MAKYTGGIVGYSMYGTIENCYNTAEVTTADSYVGGLVGNHFGGGKLQFGYSTGNVKGEDYVGGIVGELASEIRDTIALGQWAWATDSYYCGRIFGHVSSSPYIYNNQAAINMYISGNGSLGYFNTSNPNSDSKDGSNLESYQLSNLGGYLSGRWNFTSIWKMPTSGLYPILRNTPENWNVAPVVAVNGISLDQTNITFKTTETKQLNAIITPANATNKNVTWSSSNPAVASVTSNGTITGLSKGFTIITATTASGGKKATCFVTVVDKTIYYNLALRKATTGSTSPGPDKVASKATDGKLNTRWAEGSGISNSFLEVDFGKNETFDRIIIREFNNTINSFKMQYYDGTNWNDIPNTTPYGTTIGTELVLNFTPVTGSIVRLYDITTASASAAASIFEFEVFGFTTPEDINPTGNLALFQTASDNTYHGPQREPEWAVDGVDSSASRWASENNPPAGVYLEVEFEEENIFNQIILRQYSNFINSYTVEYYDGINWITIPATNATGTTMGAVLELNFDPVIASKVRLVVNSTVGTNIASITEFEVYNK